MMSRLFTRQPLTFNKFGASNRPHRALLRCLALLALLAVPAFSQTQLTSGVPSNFSYRPDPLWTVYNGSFGFQVIVPSGASSLSIQLSAFGAQGYRLWARSGSDVVNGGTIDTVTADYTGGTSIQVGNNSSPPLRAGIYYIAFASFCFGCGSVSGSITATVTISALTLSSATMTFQAPEGGPAPSSQNLLLSNSSGSTYSWTALATTTSGGNWLQLGQASGFGGTGDTALRVSVNPAGLKPGTYPGSIVITAPGLVGSPKSVQVTLTVTACTYSLTPVNVPVPAAGVSGSLNVTAGSVCPWTAVSDSSWLTISGTATGSGSSLVGYVAAVNPSTVARSGKVTVAGQTATFSQAPQAPTISQAGVVNGASFQPEIQAGSWVTIRGSLLAQTNPGRIWKDDEFVDGNLPTSLDGTSVTIDGKAAYVYFVSPTQINALAPDDTALGTVNVTVKSPMGTASGTTTVQRYSPAFFLFDPDGRRYPAAVHVDGTSVGRPNLFGGAVATRAAAPGDRILLFGTGFGPTSPSVPAGRIFQGAAPLADPSQLSVRIGNLPALVEFGGLTGNGLYQFNIVVPRTFGGDQVVVATIGGLSTQPNVFLTIAGDQQPPILSATPTGLSFAYRIGDASPPAQSLALSSSIRPLSFTVSATTATGGNWLTVNASSASTSATLSVVANPGTLAAGTYSGALRMTASDASNSPLVVPITLNVTSPTPTQQYVISTLAGTGTRGSTGDGGPANLAQVDPQDVTADGAGNVYLADRNPTRIRKIAAGTKIITTVAGGGSGGDGAPAINTSLDGIDGSVRVTVDTTGNLYILESSRVRKVGASTGVITTVAGTGTIGFSGDGGPATLARLALPSDIAVDRVGNLYIADTYNQRIRKVSGDTGIITTIAGTGQCQLYSGDGRAALASSLCLPGNVAVDDGGNIYFHSQSDSSNQAKRIMKIAAATQILTAVAGNGISGSGGDSGPAALANLSLYFGLAVDSSGTLYIGDSVNVRVRSVDAVSGIIRTIAGTGTPGSSGNGGPAISAGLIYPRRLSVDGAGNVYFMDSSMIRVLSPSR